MLEVEELKVKYEEIEAIKGISFTVNKGEIVSILGANGAGKTSTLFAISGIISAKGKLFATDRVFGKIVFRDADITKYSSSKRVKQGLILSPEGRRNFPRLTVEENLKMGAFVTGSFQNNVGMVYDLFPRLKERKKQLANTLSGGEQQMLAVGRALMGDPRLLMLDEPSLGLAPVLIDEMFGVLTQLGEKGLSILLVEQNAVRALKISDRAYVLENGNITYSGKADEMLNDDRLKKAYLGI